MHLALWSYILIPCRDFCVEAGMQLLIHLVWGELSLLVTDWTGLCKTLVYVELHMYIAVSTVTM